MGGDHGGSLGTTRSCWPTPTPTPPSATQRLLTREAREARDEELLASNATKALGAGDRAVEEEPDPYRTCFERDRDRILHDSSFRRLAGKTQVFVFPAIISAIG